MVSGDVTISNYYMWKGKKVSEKGRNKLRGKEEGEKGRESIAVIGGHRKRGYDRK